MPDRQTVLNALKILQIADAEIIESVVHSFNVRTRRGGTPTLNIKVDDNDVARDLASYKHCVLVVFKDEMWPE